MATQTDSLASQQTDRLLAPCMVASKASCVNYFDIQSGVSLAIWRNQQDCIHAENPDLHTLSLYLEGGVDAYRLDQRNRTGGPGKTCLLPAGHASDWSIDQPLRLIHLYFTEQHLDYLRLTAFDREPRLFQLCDLTYECDPRLVNSLHLFHQLMSAAGVADKLCLQERQQQLLIYLLQRYSQRKSSPIKGGLAPYKLKQVEEFVLAYLDQDISLSDLAEVACNSTYHFARMFRQSTGLSPYQYVRQRRLHRASEQLRAGESLIAVMHQSGYANHSRFARAFSQQFGVTPGVYQRNCP